MPVDSSAATESSLRVFLFQRLYFIKTIKVLDALPGTGKSTAIFNMMKKRKEEKYIYVTPLLSEIERIKAEVEELAFKSPDGNQSKSKEVLQLLLNGENIACTHSLFQDMTEEHYSTISEQGYVLILDSQVIFATEPFFIPRWKEECGTNTALLEPFDQVLNIY